MVIARLIAATFLLSAHAQAEWYAGVGLHGLHSDRENDGDIETELSFLGPRIYGGWRFSELLALEVEAGYAEFRGNLFSGHLDADLEMWNLAVTGIVYVPVDFPMRGAVPFFYAGAGRSLWNYDIVSPCWSSGRYRLVKTIRTLMPGWGSRQRSERTCGFGSAIGYGAPRCTRRKESGPSIRTTTPTGAEGLNSRRIGLSDRVFACLASLAHTLIETMRRVDWPADKRMPPGRRRRHSQCGAVVATLEDLERRATSQSQNLRSIVGRIRPSVEKTFYRKSLVGWTPQNDFRGGPRSTKVSSWRATIRSTMAPPSSRTISRSSFV